MTRTKVVVVGLGHLGAYHVDKILAMADVELVGVIDTNVAVAQHGAQRAGVAYAAALQDFTGAADAAIIAAPTADHAFLASRAIERGWHVLVEKPLAHTLEAAREVVAMAARAGRVLQVGHTERFNPAVAAALQVADRPRYIVTERLGPFSGRSTDVDVVLDLMIHDLDIVASIVPAPVREIRAVGVPVLTRAIDMASARLEFADGTVAQLSAGRASLEPSRKIRLFTEQRYVSIDCMRREVKSVRRQNEGDQPWPEISAEVVPVPAIDALSSQDAHFIHCVRTGTTPKVDGEAGVRALALAEGVKAAMTVPGRSPL